MSKSGFHKVQYIVNSRFVNNPTGVFIVNFEQTSHIYLEFSLLTLN